MSFRDFDDLLALAQAATPGSRQAISGKYMSFDLGETPQIFRSLTAADEAFAVACSRERIISLIYSLQTAEQLTHIMAGYISGQPGWTDHHPSDVLEHFREQAAK